MLKCDTFSLGAISSTFRHSHLSVYYHSASTSSTLWETYSYEEWTARCNHFDMYIFQVSPFSVHITSQHCGNHTGVRHSPFSLVSQPLGSAVLKLISISYGARNTGFKNNFSQGITNFSTMEVHTAACYEQGWRRKTALWIDFATGSANYTVGLVRDFFRSAYVG